MWRHWLTRHHARSNGVWLVSYKSAAGKPRVDYEEAVEEALCFGWIDSKAVTLDAERGMQWFSPRRPRSGWSSINKRRIDRLLAAGLMQPAGLAKIEQARRDGSWSLFDDVEALQMPKDLKDALAVHPNAAAHFEAFSPSRKKAILAWVKMAKRPETRVRRIAEAAKLSEENRRLNEWLPKKAR